jgi:hypothetical protein
MRGWRRAATLLALGTVALAACDSTVTGAGGSPSPSGPPAFQVVIVSSVSSSGPCGGAACGVVGKDQRLGFFVTTPNGGVVSGATVTAQVFAVAPGSAGEALGPAQPGIYHGAGIEAADPAINRGVYTINQSFDKPGQYRLRVNASKDGASATTEATFLVLGSDPGVAVGAPAPRSNNAIAGPGVDIATLDTGTPPDDMHYISIAGAIAARRPVVIYMGTPAFCQSRTCAPQQNAVKLAEATSRPKGIDFVHVETYRGGRPDNADISKATLSPTFLEWKLDTEPWVILVDRSGNVAAKFSGATGADEISAAAEKLLP